MADVPLGLKYHQAGDLRQAEQVYRQVLRAEPLNAGAWNLLGAACLELGRLAEAAASFAQVLRLQPQHAGAHDNLGIVLFRQGKLAEAVVSFRQAIRFYPNSGQTLTNLGNALMKQGKIDEALASYSQALRLAPDVAETYSNMGNALLKQGKVDEAAASYQEALRLKPDFAEAHHNLGIVLARQKKPAEAAACYRLALHLKPNYVEAYIHLGNLLKEEGRLNDALASYERVLRLKPGIAEVHNNRASVLLDQGKFDEAFAGYQEALRLKPDFAEARWNRSILWLLRGDYEKGWQEYEWRWKRKNSPLPSCSQPLWDGSPLAGKTILLYAEQGLGDTLHFVRYAFLVKERGGRVCLACQRPLLPLLTSCPGIDQLAAQDAPAPPFDVYAPLLSLPRMFGTTLDSVPANVPYLIADARLVEQWRKELDHYQGFKIGIAWQGNPKYVGDRQRSIPLVHFAPLGELPGVKLFSLQKGPGSEQLSQIGKHLPVIDLGPLDESAGAFMDTAAIMKNLNLVIASDSAVLHLAGALGVPAWAALPYVSDWRWLLERSDSPWYPSMRLFRQGRPGDWEEVFQRITAELRKHLTGPAGEPSTITVEVAPGELIDKITILEIKRRHCQGAALQKVRLELESLKASRDRTIPDSAELKQLTAELAEINQALWQKEDEIRQCEQAGDFGPRFVELARAIYQTNDRRSALKRKINDLLGSRLSEEKVYAVTNPKTV